MGASDRAGLPPRPKRFSLAAGKRSSFEGFGPGIALGFRDRGYAVTIRVALDPHASAETRSTVERVLDTIRLVPLSRREQTISLPAAPTDVVAGDGSVWAAAGAQLLRLDPRGGRIQRIAVPAGGDYRKIAIGLGAVWLSDGAGGREAVIVEVDPNDNRVSRTIPVGCCTIGLAVGAGSLWATRPDSGRGELLRIDPHRARIVAGSPSAAATAPSSSTTAASGSRTAHCKPR